MGGDCLCVVSLELEVLGLLRMIVEINIFFLFFFVNGNVYILVFIDYCLVDFWVYH